MFFQFAMADIQRIVGKVREALRHSYKDFVCKCLPDSNTDAKEVRSIGYETLKQALITALGDNITNHEIITICRYFSAEQAPPVTCNREIVRAAVNLELKRSLWNAIDEVKEYLFHINPLNKTFLPESKIRATLKGCRLPFPQELIDDMLKVLNQNGCGEIEVCDFLNFLDMNCGKVPDITPVNIAFELCPKIPFLHKGRLVNFQCFLQHLGLDEDLKKDGD